jgi:hypothetical protein
MKKTQRLPSRTSAVKETRGEVRKTPKRVFALSVQTDAMLTSSQHPITCLPSGEPLLCCLYQ